MNLFYKSLTRSFEIDEQENSELIYSFWNIIEIKIRSLIFRDEDKSHFPKMKIFSETDRLLVNP